MAKLKYLVIHCTATAESREVSSADIRRWHTAPVSEGGRGGEKGEVAFSLSPRRGRSLALPSPLSFPSRFVL